MNLTKAAIVFCCLLCFDIGFAGAAPAHTVKGLVITPDGTVVPECSIVVKHVTEKPELVQRKHFKNGEFTIDSLQDAKYQLQISAPLFIGVRLPFDFKSRSQDTDYRLV